MDTNLLEFYLALLSLQMAILGFVLAGIVALIQMLQSARPRRQTSLLITRPMVALYLGFLIVVLIVLCLAAWTLAFEPNWRLAVVFEQSEMAGLLLVSALVGLFSFLALTARARRLLDNHDYIEAYMARVNPEAVRDYLFKLHAPRPVPYQTDDALTKAENTRREAERSQAIAAWEERYHQVKHLTDPFQPVREYLKDNAAKSYDFGTAKGVNLFGDYIDVAFAAIARDPEPQEFFRLATYLHESAEEFFKLFVKLGQEKRKADTIRLVHAKAQKFLEAPNYEGLLTVIRGLEHLARSGADDGEIILCVERIQALTNQYVAAADESDRPWSEVGEVFEETCLCIARLAEAYYLQDGNPLHIIPMLSHNTGEYRTVTGAFVEFFSAFSQLADRFEDTYPERYFDAIEAVTEVLMTRYAEIADTAQEKVGLGNAYQKLTQRLYGIYATVGTDAIEHDKPELLALCVTNLQNIAQTARHLDLSHEQRAIAKLIKTLKA